MCSKSTKVIYYIILTTKTTFLTHVYLETQTVEECISHSDAAIHLRLQIGCLNRADNEMI